MSKKCTKFKPSVTIQRTQSALERETHSHIMGRGSPMSMKWQNLKQSSEGPEAFQPFCLSHAPELAAEPPIPRDCRNIFDKDLYGVRGNQARSSSLTEVRQLQLHPPDQPVARLRMHFG